MKTVFILATSFLLIALASFFAIAQTTTTITMPPLDAPVAIQDFIEFLVLSLGGMKGAGALAIAAAVVQILIKFLNTDWGGKLFEKIPGSYKLMVVTFLGLFGGILSLTLSGVSLGAALVHSMTLNAYMVLANQIYKQFIEKKD